MSEEPSVDLYDKHDNRAVVRLALQGHRSAAKELVKRGGAKTTITQFLEAFLNEDELTHLTSRQFSTLDDAFEEQFQQANRDTVEIVNVSVKRTA